MTIAMVAGMGQFEVAYAEILKPLEALILMKKGVQARLFSLNPHLHDIGENQVILTTKYTKKENLFILNC